jgi:hypothetical protein
LKSVKVILGLLILTLPSGLALADYPTPLNYQISSPSTYLQNEEMIWVCPTDSNIVIADWRDFRLGYRQIGLGRSTDGGNTWDDSLVNVYYYDRQSDPTMDVDRLGNFYLSMLDYQALVGNRSALTFLRSTDKGVSWPTMVKIEHPTQIYFEDKQFTAIDRTGGTYDGNIYVVWARFPNDDSPNIIMFSRSTDFDLGFEEPFAIAPPYYDTTCGWDIWGGQFAFPLVGSDGTVYAFWNRTHVDSLCNGYASIQMVVSEDGGQTFTDPELVRITYGQYGQVDGPVDVYNSPMCAADITGGPFDGNIYISYANMDITNTLYYDYNIEFIKSGDKGQTWTEPIYVNDDYVGPDAMFDQFHPWLFCNEDGVLIIIFYDQRTDPAFHYSFDAFVAYSFDGGETFTTNHRISDTSIFPAYLGKAESDMFLGSTPTYSAGKRNPEVKAGRIAEYIGVTAFHDHINAIWTDTRNTNQDAFGANWVLPILAPRLFEPTDGDTLARSTYFDWATGWKMDDDSYRIEIARDSDFTEIEAVHVVDTTGLEIDLSILGYGTHYWRIKAFKLSTGDSSEYSEVRELFSKSFICGDVNVDGTVNIFDITDLINYLYMEGPAPIPPESGDVNNDDNINIFDITTLINYLYMEGPEPVCPPI